MTRTPEGKIQKRVLDWCKKRMIGYMRLTFLPGAAVGWPDTVILLRGGAPLFIEFKSPLEEPVATAKQQDRIDWLRENGYRAEVFNNADAAIALIDRLRHEDAAGS